MKRLLVVILCVFGCVAFQDVEVEKPNCASLDEVVVIEKKPFTPAEFRAWEEESRKELNIGR